MTDKVLPFKRPPTCEVVTGEETHEAICGPCLCGKCSHEWQGVIPVGTVHLKCPNCGTMWGTVRDAITPEVSWKCLCGNSLFWLTPNGALCRKCGTTPRSWVE